MVVVVVLVIGVPQVYPTAGGGSPAEIAGVVQTSPEQHCGSIPLAAIAHGALTRAQIEVVVVALVIVDVVVVVVGEGVVLFVVEEVEHA